MTLIRGKHLVGRLVIKTLAAAILLFLIVRSVSWTALLGAAQQARISWIVGCVLLLPVNVGLEVLVWRPFLRSAGVLAPTSRILKAVLGGFPLAIVTPARFGEFVGRAMVVSSDQRWVSGASAVLARIADTIAMMGFGLMAFLLFVRIAPDLPRWTGAVGVVAALYVSGLLALYAFPRLVGRLVRAGVFRRPMGPRLSETVSFADTVPLRAKVVAGLFSACRYLIYVSQFVMALLALNVALPAGTLYVAVGFVFMARGLIPPVTIVDLGIREGLAVWTIGMLDASQAGAFDAALLLFAINMLVPALVGLPVLLQARTPSKTPVVEPA